MLCDKCLNINPQECTYSFIDFDRKNLEVCSEFFTRDDLLKRLESMGKNLKKIDTKITLCNIYYSGMGCHGLWPSNPPYCTDCELNKSVGVNKTLQYLNQILQKTEGKT